MGDRPVLSPVGSDYMLGEADADGQSLLAAASRLLPAPATPRRAVATPATLSALGLAARSDAAVWSFASSALRALVWACAWPCASAVSAFSFDLTSATSVLISSATPGPTLTCLSSSSESRSAAACWHSTEVGLVAGDAAAEVAPPDELPPPYRPPDPQAATSSPAPNATAAAFHRADLATVIRVMSSHRPI